MARTALLVVPRRGSSIFAHNPTPTILIRTACDVHSLLRQVSVEVGVGVTRAHFLLLLDFSPSQAHALRLRRRGEFGFFAASGWAFICPMERAQ